MSKCRGRLDALTCKGYSIASTNTVHSVGSAWVRRLAIDRRDIVTVLGDLERSVAFTAGATRMIGAAKWSRCRTTRASSTGTTSARSGQHSYPRKVSHGARCHGACDREGVRSRVFPAEYE